MGLALRLRPPSSTAHNLLKGAERHGTLRLRATQGGVGELAGGVRPWTGIVRSYSRCGVDLSAVDRIGAPPKRSLSCLDFLDDLHPLMEGAANPLQHQSCPDMLQSEVAVFHVQYAIGDVQNSIIVCHH